MEATGWVIVVGAIFTGLNGVIVALLKARQDKQKDTIGILTDHISRLSVEIDARDKRDVQKQRDVDELFDMVSRCEIRHERDYGWMERAKDQIDFLSDQVVKLGGQETRKLELPPRELAENHSERAAYLQRKSSFETQMGTEVAKKLTDSGGVRLPKQGEVK